MWLRMVCLGEVEGPREANQPEQKVVFSSRVWWLIKAREEAVMRLFRRCIYGDGGRLGLVKF